MNRTIGMATAFLLLLAAAVVPPDAKAEWFRDGFREIRWGSSLVDAKNRLPDLVQETWGADGEPDHHVRDRANEETQIDGVRFDRIEYLFRKGSFVGIVATARVGNATDRLYYGVLRGKLEERIGKPGEEREDWAVWLDEGTRTELDRRMNSVWLRVTREAAAP